MTTITLPHHPTHRYSTPRPLSAEEQAKIERVAALAAQRGVCVEAAVLAALRMLVERTEVRHA